MSMTDAEIDALYHEADEAEKALSRFPSWYAVIKRFGRLVAERAAKEYKDDAERYRVVRSLHWESASVCVVADPKKNVRLGANCPSEKALDILVDAIRQRGAK